MSENIVVLGSCMIDFVSIASRLPKPGETIVGTNFFTNQGGKGANQCMAAAKLGGNVALIGRLGDDSWGKEYLSVLKSYNVDTTHTLLTKDCPSGKAHIMVSGSTGDNCIIVVPGANEAISDKDIDNARNLLDKSKVLICQLEIPVALTKKILEKYSGISILNGAPAKSDIDPLILALPTIFCVNETEATTFTGLPVESIEEAHIALDALLKKGCKMVIITLGDKGALFASQKDPTPVHVSTIKVKPVDSTGAGDMFVGALAYLIAERPDLNLKIQITLACRLASESVCQMGTHTSFPDINVLNKHLDNLST